MSRVLPYQCLSIAKDLLHPSKCVVHDTLYTLPRLARKHAANLFMGSTTLTHTKDRWGFVVVLIIIM